MQFISWFDRVPWMYVYVGFSVGLESFQQYLNYRQLRRYKSEKVPEEAKNIVSTEDYIKSNKYNGDRMRFDIFDSVVNTAVSLFMTVAFVGPMLWRYAGSVVGTSNEYYHAIAFIGCSTVVGEVLSLPFELYNDFVIEERHGFNNKTLALFFKDKVLGLAISASFGIPIISSLLWLMKWGGKRFYVWTWAFTCVTFFAMTILYPNFIAPLFNKFKSIEDKELSGKIEHLASEQKFPLAKLYEMDGSKRSSHSNAYFYGFWWSKRIVLYDTLLKLPHDCILAIIGHEMGHWKLRHTSRMIVASLAHTFAVLYLYGLVMYNDAMFNSFGFTDTRSPIIGLMLFVRILSPVNTLLSLGMTHLTRVHEFQADEFACQLGYSDSLCEGLIELHKENKGTLDPDPWYSWWHYSHPPLLERMRAIRDWEKRAKKSS